MIVTDTVGKDLTRSDRILLFWASFLALAAAAFGFVLRVMLPDVWGKEFNITAQEVGQIAGAGLWPIAITMVLFSLLVDRIGYRTSMFCALILQTASVVLTIMAETKTALWWACFAAGLGHGIVEAVINPLCAAIYRDQKSKMLNIVHASWPAGIVCGGCVYLLTDEVMAWRLIFAFMLIPIVAYGVMFAFCRRYPVDERVEKNVPMSEMLKEFGGLGAFVALTFVFYELMNQLIGGLAPEPGSFLAKVGSNLLMVALAFGAIGGFVFGIALRSKGKLLFFILCLVMIPLATAELATDGWIRSLMEPVLRADYELHAGWAIVCSAFIMMSLRFFAGVPLKYMSPPGLLLFSSVCSIIGLYLLSYAVGPLVFLAFVFYAVGQTFYWPTVQGLVSEQLPKGGAMTLNTVAAIGLLTVGIFGFPFLGAVKDHFDAQTVKAKEPALFEKYKIADKSFFGWKYDSIKVNEIYDSGSLSEEGATSLKKDIDTSARKTLRVAAVMPLIMAIVFGAMVIWFRTRGGYRTVRIE